jgi:hypothetical protein
MKYILEIVCKWTQNWKFPHYAMVSTTPTRSADYFWLADHDDWPWLWHLNSLSCMIFSVQFVMFICGAWETINTLRSVEKFHKSLKVHVFQSWILVHCQDSKSKMINVQGWFKLLLCWEMVIVKWRESSHAFQKVSRHKVRKRCSGVV